MTMKYLQRKNNILRCTSFGYSMKMSEIITSQSIMKFRIKPRSENICVVRYED